MYDMNWNHLLHHLLRSPSIFIYLLPTYVAIREESVALHPAAVLDNFRGLS